MSDDLSVRIKGDPSGGVAAFEKVSAAGESAMQRIQKANTSITESTAKLTGVITGLATSFAATAFMSGVKTQLDLADAMDESAQKAGMATSAFSEYAYAGRFAGLETEGLVKVFNKVNEAVVKAASGDEKMKGMLVDTLQVQVRNAAGQLRGVDEVMMELIDKLSSVSDQGLKSAAVMEIFGEKLGPQLLPLINLTKQGVQDLREEARKLGVVVSDEAGAAAGDLNDNLDRLRATQQGVYNQIMTQMLPGLNALAQAWLDNNKNAGIFKGTLQTIGQALKESLGFGELNKLSLEAHYAAVRVRMIVTEMERLQKLASENPGALVEQGYGQPAILATERLKQLRGEYEKAMQYAQAATAKLNAGADRRDGGVKPPSAGGAGSPSGDTGAVEAALAARIKQEADEKTKKAEQEKQRAAKSAAAEARREAAERTRAENEERKRQKDLYEDRVAQLRLQLAEWRNNTTQQMALAEQIAQNARQQFGEESQEYSKAQQEIVKIKQRAADQQRQIEDELRSGREAAALASVELEQQQADEALALGLMTQRERLALEEAFENRMTEIKRKAMEERLQVLESDPDMNPVERARIQQQIEELDRQHQARKGQIKGAQRQERAKPGMAVIDNFEQNLSGQTTRLLMQQQSTMEALRNLWTSTASVFVDEMVTKPLAAWVAGQARMTLASIMGTETRVAAAATGAAMEESITAASVVKMIAMKAWSVAASVYAAIAGIPFVGPFIAPVMAIGAVAAVMGFARNVFSAENGFDIPAGVNPMVQAHAREMILPAKYADVIRGLAGSGGGGGGSGGSVIHINALDSRSIEKWLRGSGGSAIVQELALRQRSRRAG